MLLEVEFGDRDASGSNVSIEIATFIVLLDEKTVTVVAE